MIKILFEYIKKHFTYATPPPLFLCTLALIGGIASAHSVQYASALIVICFFISNSFYYTTSYKKIIHTLVCLFCFFLGYIDCTLVLHKRQSTPSSFTLRKGIIEDIYNTGKWKHPYRITLKDESKQNHFIYAKTIGNISIGDRIVFDSLKSHMPQDKGMRWYLFRNSINSTAFVTHLTPKKIQYSQWNIRKFFYTQKQTILKKAREKLSPKSYTFFASLFMGEKSQFSKTTQTQKRIFKQWGISHYLARSGLHLVVFILLWKLLLSYAPLPFLAKHLILFFLTLLYFLLTPLTSSFLRAWHLFALDTGLIFLNSKQSFLHLLSLVCFFTLLYNPLHLFFLDFQLSFYCTFCLAWVHETHLAKKKH